MLGMPLHEAEERYKSTIRQNSIHAYIDDGLIDPYPMVCHAQHPRRGGWRAIQERERGDFGHRLRRQSLGCGSIEIKASSPASTSTSSPAFRQLPIPSYEDDLTMSSQYQVLAAFCLVYMLVLRTIYVDAKPPFFHIHRFPSTRDIT
nr:hypothetical protein CFP56_72741 [Quercus suber]